MRIERENCNDRLDPDTKADLLVEGEEEGCSDKSPQQGHKGAGFDSVLQGDSVDDAAGADIGSAGRQEEGCQGFLGF